MFLRTGQETCVDVDVDILVFIFLILEIRLRVYFYEQVSRLKLNFTHDTQLAVVFLESPHFLFNMQTPVLSKSLP